MGWFSRHGRKLTWPHSLTRHTDASPPRLRRHFHTPYPPPVELTPLRYFSAIAASGHMTQAARQLGVTQPALSAMLKKLEREVGAQLVHRVGRGIELSEAGRLFLAYADQTLRAAEAGVQAVRELAGLERGSIRVGGGATATTYLLPRVVSAVRKDHPGLRFYELPTIGRIWEPVRNLIDGGMAAAIRDPVILQRTLTIYGDVNRVTRPLGIDDRSTITVLLVDRDSQVRWHESGGFAAPLAEDLEAVLSEERRG